MIKLAIFDFDGVIADVIDLAVETINKMLSDEGHSKRISKKDVREKGLKGLVNEFKVPAYKVPFYIHRSREIVNRKIDSVKIFPGIKDALIKLKENYKLAIVTSNSKDNLEVVLKNNGMEELFGFTISGVGVFGKSSKIRKTMKLAGASRKESVCIGDEERDIEAARKIGIKIIAVSWGFNSERLLAEKKPDHIVRKPKELVSLIKNIL